MVLVCHVLYLGLQIEREGRKERAAGVQSAPAVAAELQALLFSRSCKSRHALVLQAW
jgi:hypothetical protein